MIEQDIVHLEGLTDPKRLDVNTMFRRGYKSQDHQIRIGRINLSTFRLKGTLSLSHLGPAEFEWSVQRPSTSEVGTWRDLDMAALRREGGQSLYASAVCQPWSN